MSEEHPLLPTTPYAIAKAGADRLVYSYYVTYGIPAVIVRPFNNYGPHQHLEKVTPRFIPSALLTEPVTIHGDGKSSRDWLFVEDHCEAIDRLIHADIEKIKGTVINIGTGKDQNIETIAHMILDIMRKPRDLVCRVGERPGQVQRHISSTDRAWNILNWQAKTDLFGGMEKTIEWWAEALDDARAEAAEQVVSAMSVAKS